MRTVVVAGLLCAACTPIETAPEPTSLDPSDVSSRRDTTITVTGRNFFPAVSSTVTGGAAVTVDELFVLTAVDASGAEVALTDVTYVDETTLTGVVPSGLDLGVYGLTVESPGGAVGTLDAALRVSEGVESIRLSASPIVEQVDGVIEVTVDLVDEDGAVVDGPLDITIVATDPDGDAVGVAYDASDLDDAVPDAAGTVTGTVPAAGTAVLSVAHDAIEEVTLLAVPTDDSAAIAGDDLSLSWVDTLSERLEIDLPSEPTLVEAGTLFSVTVTHVDDLGVPVVGETIDVNLSDACGSFEADLSVTGSATVDVTVTAASGVTGCATQRLWVTGDVPGLSDTFTVTAASASALDIALDSDSIAAGASTNATITAVDVHGNESGDVGAITSVSDDHGALPLSCAGDPVVCSIQPSTAGEDLTLTATDGALMGTTTYTVVAGAAAGVVVEDVSDPQTVDEPFVVTVARQDTQGNDLDLTGADDTAFSFTTDPAVSCVFAAWTSDGRGAWSCVASSALVGTTIQVDDAVTGDSDTTSAFDVN